MKQPNRILFRIFGPLRGESRTDLYQTCGDSSLYLPESEDAGFILDLDYSIQRQKNEQMELEVISDTEIRGRKKTVYWAFDQYINFYAKFSKPFTYTLVTDSMTLDEGGPLLPTAKALLQFQTEPNEEVLVKVGVSAVDMDGARKNVEAEISGWDFDGVRRAARQQWNTYLSKIDIDTKDNDQRTMFYTALYHTGMQPNLFTDADGRYFGMDLKPHQGRVDEPIYTIFSLWDTFRAYHPLMTIIDPELNEAFIRSLIQKSREGGVLPMWELAGNYTGTMIGYHAASLIADSYVKGYRNFDVQEAYKACLRTAEYDTTGIITHPLVVPHLMPQASTGRTRLATCLAIKTMNLWLKLWNMLTMTGVSPYWQVLWTTKPTAISMRLLPRDIKFISIRVPASCADWTVRATGVRLSTPALPITVMMTIAKVRHGSGLGSFPTMWTDWWN